MNKILGLLSLLLLSTSSYAYFFSSPQGNCYINEGDTMSQVEQACGSPTAKKDGQHNPSTTQVVEYWNYDNTVRKGSLAPSTSNANSNSRYTIHQDGDNMLFVVTDGKVTSMNVNGSPASSTRGCGGSSVEIGMTSDKLLSACGNPTNKSVSQQNVYKKPVKITTWTYDLGEYRSPLTLTFDAQGKLTKINPGN